MCSSHNGGFELPALPRRSTSRALGLGDEIWRNTVNGIAKGQPLADVTAHKEYGVSRDFIVRGIRAGKLEYREGSIWGNPYIRVLRSQLEQYIIEQLGSKHLMGRKTQTELRKINKEIADLKKELTALQARKAELERSLAN